MSSDIKEGKYLGKIVEYGMASPRSPEGSPVIAVTFEFKAIVWDELTSSEIEEVRKLTWSGYLSSDKATEMTMKALNNIFGCKDIQKFPLGFGSGAIDEERTYELDIARETYNGKEYTKIKWVNIAGQGGRGQRMGTSDATSYLNSSGLAEKFFAYAAENKDSAPKPKEAKNHAEPSFNSDEKLPF